MKSITTKHESSQAVAATAVYLFDDWFDPIESAVRVHFGAWSAVLPASCLGQAASQGPWDFPASCHKKNPRQGTRGVEVCCLS